MKQLYFSLKKAGLMFKCHTEQGEVDFILTTKPTKWKCRWDKGTGTASHVSKN